MKALTIWQPWASLIMLGAKPFEFRRYPAPRFARNQRIVIHAGARPAKIGELMDLYANLGGPNDGSYLDPEIARPFLEKCQTGMVVARPLEYRCGLGTALLGEPVKAIDVPAIREKGGDQVDPEMWAWPLTEIRRWAQPFDAVGAQGFWDWYADDSEDRP